MMPGDLLLAHTARTLPPWPLSIPSRVAEEVSHTARHLSPDAVTILSSPCTRWHGCDLWPAFQPPSRGRFDTEVEEWKGLLCCDLCLFTVDSGRRRPAPPGTCPPDAVAILS